MHILAPYCRQVRRAILRYVSNRSARLACSRNTGRARRKLPTLSEASGTLPETAAYKLSRIQLANRGLAELRKFDRRQMTDAQRLSAELMEWQLDLLTKGERFLDYEFPLQQMNGVNVNLVEVMTVRHPLNTERDAENYVAALGQVGIRMDEAIAEHRRIGSENVIPPTFILNVTINQMQAFVALEPRNNPFVTVFTKKMESISSMSPARGED